MSLELRIFVVALVGVVALFFGLGALLPSSWEVESSVHVAAPPSRVLPLLGDFEQWKQWSTVVATERTDMRMAIEGAPATVGHRLVWRTSTNEALLRLVRAGTDGVEYEFLTRLGTDQELQLQGQGALLVTADGDGSRVRWRDRGLVQGLGSRWFAWFGAQQDNARRLQQASLERLSRQLEHP